MTIISVQLKISLYFKSTNYIVEEYFSKCNIYLDN